MKKASGRLTMSMQPRRELEGKPVTRLMDVQDNTGRGDGERDHQPSHRTMASNQMNIRFYINKYSATFSVYLA